MGPGSRGRRAGALPCVRRVMRSARFRCGCTCEQDAQRLAQRRRAPVPDAARAMTPFGARLRALRPERGLPQRQLATELQVSTAYLSALEHGKRGAPSAGLVHQVNEFFGLIWDDADELRTLARLSNPRVTVNTAGLSPEQTALANRLAQAIHRLSPETVAALHAILDSTTPQPKPRLRRLAHSAGRADRQA